jgi:hypothetical protein
MNENLSKFTKRKEGEKKTLFCEKQIKNREEERKERETNQIIDQAHIK